MSNFSQPNNGDAAATNRSIRAERQRTPADGLQGYDSEFQLHRDSRGRLVLSDVNGTEHVGIEPVRAFPITAADCWISLLDASGREVACIADLAALPATQRSLVLEELASREFLPRIERVIRVVDSKEPYVWDVLTDRGPVQFLLRDDDIRRLGPNRAIFVDMHGVRYYIPDSRQLDAKSRRILSQYL